MTLYTNTEFPTLTTWMEPFSSERPSSKEIQDETQNELEKKELPGTVPTWPSILASPSKLSPTLQLIKNLEAYQYKPEDERWPGAEWPNEKAFEDAYIFIQHLDLTSIPIPIIALADDGEVNFLWKYDPVHVDLGFYGTDTYSYFACHKDGRESIGENVPASEGLLPEIIQFFLE